ncbi:MAG: hypothetical protein AB1505_00655 [Candidatus Latescibacterota bacterium]
MDMANGQGMSWWEAFLVFLFGSAVLAGVVTAAVRLVRGLKHEPGPDQAEPPPWDESPSERDEDSP